MLKERIQEIFEFTKSESPYRKANKGWINQDVFLDLSASSNTLKQKNEAARVTLLWSPINSLLSNIFLIFVIGSFLVYSSISFVKGRFNFNLFNTSLINEIVKVEEKKVLNTNELNSSEPLLTEIENNFDEIGIDESNEINLSANNQINLDNEIVKNRVEQKEKIIKDIESNKNLKKQKSRSNFI